MKRVKASIRHINLDDEAPQDLPHLRRYTGAILTIVLSFVAYANSLGNGFTYDDVPIIRDNPAVLEIDQGQTVPWYTPWLRPYWPDTNKRLGADVLYRPFAVQTYAWDMRFLGPSGWWFHLVNIVLHASVSVGVWWMMKHLSGSSALGTVAGLIFAVHPIHTEAVSNIVGRAEILAAAGTLAAIYATHRMLTTRPVIAGLWAAGAILSAGISVFSKESGVAVLPIVAVYAWWRWQRDNRPGIYIRRVIPILTAMLGLFVVYLALRYQVCEGRLTTTGQLGGAGNVLRETPGLPRMITWVSLLGRYVGLMLWPARLMADYAYAVIRPTRSVLEPYFLLGLLTFVLMIRAAIVSWRGGRTACVALAGFFFTYILISNSILLIAVMMAERWFYAPSIWLLILALLGVQAVHSRYRDTLVGARFMRSSGPLALFILLLAVLCVRTWLRNPDWSDVMRLIDSDLRATTSGNRSAHFLATQASNYLVLQRNREALLLAREAAKTYPESAAIRRTLGEALLANGNPREAIEALKEAQRIDPPNMDVAALLEQAQLAAQGVDLNTRLRQAHEHLQQNPKDAEAHYAVGYLLESMTDYAQAAEYYRKTAELKSDHIEAWQAWARCEASQNRVAEAVAIYEKILARWPDDWQAHANIAIQFMQKQLGPLYQPQKAIEHAERARQLAPADMKLQLTINLAEVYASTDQADRAVILYEEVCRGLPPDDPQQRRFKERIDFLRRQGTP